MYNNPYMQNAYNTQPSIDRINAQMAELENLKQQLSQRQNQAPTNLTQNFQIAPNNKEVIKYATSIDEVQKDIVFGDTPYFSKDMSIVWVKNAKGEIKTYELNEIIQKDEKDILITNLQMQVEDLRKEIEENAKSINDDVNATTSSEKSANVSNTRTSTKKSK